MLVKSDIIEILNEALKQQGKLRKASSQLLFNCPFCNRYDSYKKLEVCVDGDDIGLSHCWRCNFKAKTFGSLLKRVNASPSLRNKMFALSGEVKKTRKSSTKKKRSDLFLPDEFITLSKPSKSPEYRNAIAYLKQRNVFMPDILRYNIGYCEEGEYAHNIIIPSYNVKNELNFFVGRRYYQTEGILPHKKPFIDMNIIAFENMINWNWSDGINLVEGAFDALAVRTNSIPLFGKYMSKKLQEKIIEMKVSRVNMILDNDAVNDAIKNCETLIKYGINVYLVLLDGKDPSKLGFEKMKELISNAKPLTWDGLMRFKLKRI